MFTGSISEIEETKQQNKSCWVRKSGGKTQYCCCRDGTQCFGTVKECLIGCGVICKT